jgi:hypothetical protein
MSVTLVHDHVPIYRVVQRAWVDPLDTEFSQLPRVDNSISRILQEGAQPRLIEIHWIGEPIDMITETGIVASAFPLEYPIGAGHRQTQHNRPEQNGMLRVPSAFCAEVLLWLATASLIGSAPINHGANWRSTRQIRHCCHQCYRLGMI